LKGPLVLAYRELHQIASNSGAFIFFSATVCGGLPIINIGRRDILASEIILFRGVLNSTTNYILCQMKNGISFHDALKEAQDRGIAETDPSLDVEGWDTANKLLLCCHSIMDLDCSLKDISVEGISSITIEMIKDASNSGKIYKLIAEAKKTENGYKLSVRPTLLGKEDFLGLCNDWEMAVEIHSDLFGKMYHKIWEREPIPTASSMLRDCIHSFQIRNSHHKLEQLH